MAPTAELKHLATVMATENHVVGGKAVPNGVIENESKVTTENGDNDGVAKVGMQCDLKNLYQKEDERGRTSWTDKYPEDLDEAAENEITARYAILVRNKKSFDSRKKLDIDSIVVQSPLLKQVLSKVLKDYPGKIHSSSRYPFDYHYRFNPPYR